MAVIGGFLFPGYIINHSELNGKSVLTNGLEPMQKYNPVTGVVLPLVLRPFRQDITLAGGGAGNLSGVYVYRVVPYNINEDEEGQSYPLDEDNAAFEYTAAAAGEQVSIDLTDLVADNAEVTHVRVYRSFGDGTWPVLARVAEVEYPVLAPIIDNIDDEDLDIANEGINQFIQVPTPKPFIITHNSRLFAWGDVPYEDGQITVTNGSDRVTASGTAVFGFWLVDKELHVEGDGKAYFIDGYDPDTEELILREEYLGTTRTDDYRICGDPDRLIWTEPDFENEWPGANNRPVNHKEDDKPTGLYPQGRRIILAKSKKTYALYYNNQPAIPYSSISVLSTQYGCVGHRTMKDVEGTIMWLSRDGVVAAQPEAAVKMVSRPLGTWVNDNLRLDANGTQQMAFSVVWKENGQFMCNFPGQDSVLGCNLAAINHYLERKWSTFEWHNEFTVGENVVNLDGKEVVVFGDRLGYLWEYPYLDNDGSPENSTVSGTVTAYFEEVSPGCILYDENARYVTEGLGLAGIPIYIHTGTGLGQWAIIAGNDATTLWLEDCFDVALDETSEYYIGSIEAQYKSGWADFGTVDREKRMMYANLVYEKNPSDLEFRMYGDFSDTEEDLRDKNWRESSNTDREDASDVNMNGDETDAEHQRGRTRVKLGGVRKTHLAWELYDDRPNNPWSIYDLSFDVEMKEN